MTTEKNYENESLDSVINDTGNLTESVFTAGSENNKNATASSNHISEIGEDSEEIIRQNKSEKTPEEIENENWLRMNRDKRNLSVKRAFVTGIKPDKKNNTVYFVTKLYGMTVFIPDTEYFMPDFRFSNAYAEKSEKEKYLERLNLAQYQKGARIMFVITDLERKEIPAELLTTYDDWDSKWIYNIRGSRKRAMEICQYAKFYNPKRDEKNNPLPKEGDVVKANILSVRSDGCRVEALGVESFVSNFELTGTRWVENAQDEVRPGDWFWARIKTLHINKNDVYMSVSGRLYDTGKTSKNILLVEEGDFYNAVIRSFNPNSKKYTAIMDNGVLCAIDEKNVVHSVALEPGDIVSVKVIDVLKEYVIGIALKA